MKKLLSLLLVLSMCLSLSLALAEETQSFTDSVGREVTLPKNIERIVPSGPLSQMVLVTLAPEMFVAAASAFDEDEIAFIKVKEDLPVVGAVYGKGDINLEALAATDPQVILDIGEPKKSIAEDMDGIATQTGIPTVHITAYLETMGDAYRTLGALLGLEERANKLADYCDKAYARGLEIMEKVGEENKVPVLYVSGDDGLRVIPQGNFNSQTLDMMTQNVAIVENAKGNSAQVDMEQIYLFDSAFIMFDSEILFHNAPQDPLWKDMDAIKEGNYVKVPQGPYNWIGFPPSVQRYLGILWMGKLFYPEAADYDLQEEVAAYYELFYQKPLTEEGYNALMENGLRAID